MVFFVFILLFLRFLSPPSCSLCRLTETLCGGTITHPEDRALGNVGAPVACCQLMLRDVREMGYTHEDKPKPRGEICIGGPNVSLGYFKLQQQTDEAYFEKDGVRYFATGDIGTSEAGWDGRGLT
jgi:long-chain acyl-CoA synthetase